MKNKIRKWGKNNIKGIGKRDNYLLPSKFFYREKRGKGEGKGYSPLLCDVSTYL